LFTELERSHAAMHARVTIFEGDPAFVYDEEKDLFRWVDGRFAFSREHANWDLLRKRGRLRGM
jgi:hypothetical protein